MRFEAGPGFDRVQGSRVWVGIIRGSGSPPSRNAYLVLLVQVLGGHVDVHARHLGVGLVHRPVDGIVLVGRVGGEGGQLEHLLSRIPIEHSLQSYRARAARL